jgi:hypothetical protein
MESSAQPGQDINRGCGRHDKGDLNGRDRSQNEAAPAEQGNPGAQFLGFFFVHRVLFFIVAMTISKTIGLQPIVLMATWGL